MKNNILIYRIFIFITSITALVFTGCGDKLDLSLFPVTNNGTINVSDTVYILQSPIWTGFNSPEDIIVGIDQLIYVCDTKNNRIVQMDFAGDFISSRTFNANSYPRKISQDYNFDLLVLSDSTTAVDTITVLHRLKLVENGGLVENARIITLMTSLYPTPNTSKYRKYTGVSMYPDNTYIITRIGPGDPIGIDPGNAILKLRGIETVTNVEKLTGFQTTGNSFYSIENVSSIRVASNSSSDFIITRNTSDTVSLNKVIWFIYNYTNGSYDPKFTSPIQDLVSIKFGSPKASVQDVNSNIYVADALRNHLYKFNSSGKLMAESFGKFGSGDNELNSPSGVAHYNKILYIADTKNNRIVRYKLSTDIN
jgi:hypothetical protein